MRPAPGGQRVALGFWPTPLHRLPRLSARLGGPEIWIKRDDQTGLALGGNKTRKLEYLIHAALADEADAVLTGGAAQSNHCRQTAAAAAAVGLDCHLVLGGDAPAHAQGNLLLDRLLGATLHWAGAQRRGEGLDGLAEHLRRSGQRPYTIPYGGSNAIGALGFVGALKELGEQLAAAALALDRVVFASSSGGTQAGLEVGRHYYGHRFSLTGIQIDPAPPEHASYVEAVGELAQRTAARLGLASAPDPAAVDVRPDYAAPGYGVVGDAEREAIDLLAQTEGILVDPVYSGRAMAGLIDLVRQGEMASEERVLFWHTGGAPALWAYADELVTPQ